jgi:GDP-4-dehydro-6-deoxy-D-mannose reductase
VSKTAGDQLAGIYSDAYGLDIVRTRPFNHAGPGQQASFLISSLAQQAARARLQRTGHLRLVTGNPDTRRDFTDVRDVARAYRLLAAPAVAAGPYNISSGRSTSVTENVATVAEMLAPIEIEHVVDPSLLRAGEVMDRRGCYERLRRATGWEPQIPLRTTIADAIDRWEAELG